MVSILVLLTAGLLLIAAGLFAANKIMVTDAKGTLQPHPFSGVIRATAIIIGLLIISYSGFNGVFFYAEPGYIYHVRTILGQERVVDGVGYKVYLFGRKNAWKKAMTVQAVADASYVAEGNTEGAETETASSATLPPQTILFLDQVDAKGQATARFRLPSDEHQFLRLAHEYRTPANFLSTSLIPAFRETLQATGSLMSAEEYYSGGRTEFNTEFENQMQNGIYIVRRREIVVEDPSAVAPGSANASKGTKQSEFGDQKRVIFKVEKVMTSTGQPSRKSQKYVDFGVTVVDARITDMDPNEKFVERMQLKQKASADRAIAREQRIQEEEQRLLAIAKGEREVAQRQATAKVEQIQKTTDAETQRQLAVTQANMRRDQANIDRETAEVQLARAEIDAKAKRVAADAAAYEKRAIIEADNALAEKLDAYVKTQEFWASAFARRSVPHQMFGTSGGNSGPDMDVNAFMQLMTAKAARDLSFDPGLDRESVPKR